MIQLNFNFNPFYLPIFYIYFTFISSTTCPKYSTNKRPQLPTSRVNNHLNKTQNEDNTTTDPPTITTDRITTTTDPTTMINPTKTTTENPDTKTDNKELETSLVLSMKSPKLVTTPKFQKCPKNLNKNPMKPNTTKKFKTLNIKNPN